MLSLAIALILGLGVAPAAADHPEPRSRIMIDRDGSAGVDSPLPSGPTPLPTIRRPGAAVFERDREDRRDEFGRGDPDEDEKKRHKKRKPDRRPLLFLDDDDDDEERIIVVPAPPAEPEEPEEAAPVAPLAPPDPRGPRFVPARGAAGEAPYTVGEPLPEGVPFVTLDWDQYGLPEPLPGLIYARVAGDVLLIDPATRRVERRVEPAELETARGEGSAGEGAPGSE